MNLIKFKEFRDEQGDICRKWLNDVTLFCNCVTFTGTVEVTVGGLPGGLSFLQPAKNTINSIAMIGNTFFLSFILVYFKLNYIF